jgi:hypothetical protein
MLGNNQMTLRDQAEFLARALESGLKTVPEVIAWADEKIVQLKSPPHWLLELSLMGNAKGQDVLHVLSHVEGVADERKVYRGIFGLILEQVTSSRMTGYEAVRFLRWQNIEIPEDVYWKLASFDAYYEDWFEFNASRVADLDRELIAFLERQSRPFPTPESSNLFP